MLPFRAREDLGAMAMKECSTFPNAQHYWNLIIGRSHPSVEVQSVYSTDLADRALLNCWAFVYCVCPENIFVCLFVRSLVCLFVSNSILVVQIVFAFPHSTRVVSIHQYPSHVTFRIIRCH